MYTFMDKLRSRTEWQAFLVAVIVLFCNRFFSLGLTDSDIYALFAGAGMYGVGRGLAKYETFESLPDDAMFALPEGEDSEEEDE